MIQNIDTIHVEKSMKLLEKFFNATEYGNITEFDYESTLDTLLQLMQSGVVKVATQDSEVVGIAGGIIYPWYFNKQDITAQEVFWWVEPDHRGNGLGKELFKAFEDAIKQKGAKSLTMVALDSNKDIGKVYKKEGYSPSEHSYIRRL